MKMAIADWGSGSGGSAVRNSGFVGRRCLVLGLGKTGVSVLRYLQGAGARVRATDRDSGRAAAAGDGWCTPEEALAALAETDLLVVSPGVPSDSALLAKARERDTEIVGDIELFARALSSTPHPRLPAPVVAVTGTNGKSTVAMLVAAMAERAGRRVAAGANLGTPALELLDPAVELYVLELSSFQLEPTKSLAPLAAAVLNVSPDHLDRYPDLASYAAAKARIFRHCEVAVFNRADPLVRQMIAKHRRCVGFGLDEPAGEDYGLRLREGEPWLCRGRQWLLAAAEVPLAGSHNLANVLAAWALAAAAGVPDEAIAPAVREFRGLPHRLSPVGLRRGVHYLDDSKATNVSAASAAIAGLDGPLVVIAGGQGKGQDFGDFADLLVLRARAVILLGVDAPRIASAIAGRIPVIRADSMSAAVAAAARCAQPGDRVLLSPACASLDQFRDYRERGEAFAAAVEALDEH
ncbi:MAG TPA: UDP-N-acetylmuramoyl-L-alanine--D-glutamate ligase [Gammaproteobacteria bacterium]|nr:UDP-N-acetylmuramoyl-L-alanine--D-glutamate ligase [Gammaproteobacteria bacterium]